MIVHTIVVNESCVQEMRINDKSYVFETINVTVTQGSLGFYNCAFRDVKLVLSGNIKFFDCTFNNVQFASSGEVHLRLHRSSMIDIIFERYFDLTEGDFNQTAFYLLSARSNVLANAKFTYISGDGKIFKNFYFHRYHVCLGPKYMSIGCTCRTYEEWLAMSETDAECLEEDGASWYRVHRDELITLIKALGAMPYEIG